MALGSAKQRVAGGLLAWATLLGGCSPTIETGGGDTDTVGTDSGSTGAADGGSGGEYGCPVDDACASHSCGDEPCDWQCTSTPLCDAVAFDDPGNGLTVDDVDAAHCVLEAMRDGLVGEVQWSHGTFDMLSGQTRTTMSVDLVEGRLALVRNEYANLGGAPVNLYNYDLEGPASLQPPTYFTDCLTETDPQALRDCLFGSVLGCP